MKLKTEYRYVVWNLGVEWKVFSLPHNQIHAKPYSGWNWNEDVSFEDQVVYEEPHLLDYCPGEWHERIYDMEDENDRQLIEALIIL